MLEIMESFKDLLQKLQEAHEREVEVLQVKVKELSNKKGCDTKRMEELFTRNQQMKEQQRLLTENIKTLENRLRAGLCDRCTVTQEVAKRRQQEYEASRIQSLQHISLLAGEMTNLRKENLKLKEDIASLRATLESCSEHNNNNSVDVKPKMSPDLLSPGAVALVSPTISRSRDQLADGDVLVKTEADHRETECRLLRRTNQSSFEVYKPQPTLASSWKTEHRVNRGGEKSIEALDQHSSIHTLHLRKKSSSSPSGEVRPSRPVIHAPIPCHPKPIKSGTVSLPWPLSEGPNWGPMAAVGANPALQNPSRGPHLSRLSSLIPPISQATTRRHDFGSSWQSQKQSTPQPPKEPTVVFTFRRMPENIENETKAREKKESPPSKTQKVSGEELRESSDGPLDLSDRAKTKPNQPGNDDSPIALQCEGDTQRSPDRNVNTAIPVSSPSLISLPSSSSSTPIKQEQELISDHNHEVEDQDKKEEANDKTEQTNGKKVPVLTLSLRPALVRLETLTSALQKQESISSNGKQKCPSVASPCVSSASSQSLSSANEADSSLDEQEGKSGPRQKSKAGRRRKRLRIDTETDRDSDTNKKHQERRIKITVRTEERSPS
ncbi:DNA endonuclease RBBP8 isoform X2 [Poecilia latipinna]|uniref:Retinoblastoma binding protein 8-like n=1 Tax=Poecilia formosa TaxID=48698 RepID=A0A096LUW8_POEFO|nr:PREDICTED: DNA endonuclease RBBP8 isoform X2 [Poecilia formosa]XP_014895462.1 PREDICTED: DNA endonuclease RBBP8-like isoform X2 [Poecilia latipinna]